MLIVGLTGGIGSGKSTVARCFAELAVPIIDADVIARNLVEPGTDALREITAAFGDDILQADGSLDRTRLRRRVFEDSTQRKRLEAILHPRVRSAIRQRLSELNAPYCIVVIPLLVEADQRDLVHRVLLVDASEATQYQRVMQRDGMSRRAVRDILDAQADRATRRAVADDILLNDGDLEQLRDAVARLHAKFQRLAHAE